jgi:hypothetical protein
VYEDQRFRDEVAKLEVDIVALEMMVLRVLRAEKSGKQSLDVAGLLKIRGSEIQQRYSELMMLAAGPTACLHPGSDGSGWQGDHVGARLRGAAGIDLLQHAQDDDLRRQQRKSNATSSRLASRTPSRSALTRCPFPTPPKRKVSVEEIGLRMDFDFSDDQEHAARHGAASGWRRPTPSNAVARSWQRWRLREDAWRLLPNSA